MTRAGSREHAIALAERSLTGGFLMAEEPLLSFQHAPVVLAIAGELGRALRVYDEALARTRARGAMLSMALIAALRSFAAHQSGRLAEAAVVEGGTGGARLLREAVETAAAGEARLEQLRALVDLGALERRAGSRRAAREHLREGLDMALACGARPVAERAHAELVASGAQPRRLRTSGPDALTAAERRVAAMAAEGMTNRAIAQALFVSEKTVETHLRGVFRKLDVASRSQLPAALG